MKRICICGGGSLGQVIAGFLSAKGHAQVNILTSRPAQWQKSLDVFTPEGEKLQGEIANISADPLAVITQSDVVLLCVPGFLIRKELEKIAPHLQAGTFVGSVFSSTGFFFEALEVLPDTIPLWGFQRVPFIARTKQYGQSADLLGYKDSHKIAVERASSIVEKEAFRAWVEEAFERPTCLLHNYYEASLTNSNPLLHTARLYSLFHDYTPATVYPQPILFYEAWSDETSELLVRMDEEFFQLLATLPVEKGYLPPLLEYYESKDAQALTCKIRSIQSFKGIRTPMKEVADGWIPDFDSRYFTEDFPYGLRLIRDLARKQGLDLPTIERVYAWGETMIGKYS